MKYGLLAITKPGIAGGVALSGLAGMALATKGLPDRWTLLVCTTCIILAAAGSAILNVLFEEKTDALMPRVSKRAEALARIGAGRAGAGAPPKGCAGARRRSRSEVGMMRPPSAPWGGEKR